MFSYYFDLCIRIALTSATRAVSVIVFYTVQLLLLLKIDDCSSARLPSRFGFYWIYYDIAFRAAAAAAAAVDVIECHGITVR